jgi:hypothetical protein
VWTAGTFVIGSVAEVIRLTQIRNLIARAVSGTPVAVYAIR